MIPARAAAAGVVAAVVRGRALDTAVATARQRVSSDEGALLQQLAYGAVRYWYRLEPIVQSRLKRPLKRRDGDVLALLVVALYELFDMRTPAHAAVNAAVEATRGLDKGWAGALVNGVLRGVLRQRGVLADSGDPQRDHGWPDWLAAAVRADWPADWPAIAASGTARAPLTLRVNVARTTREDYRERLAAAGIEAHPHAHAPAALELATPVPVESLPGFDAGAVSVQDAAAQLAAPLLAPVAGLRVLDACAAPGGKAAHLAELGPPARLVAVERDAARGEDLRATLARLDHAAQVHVADAGAPATWWDGQPFDRILLDAPCSGTGVIRRHPDIRLLRRASDIDQLNAIQDDLLAALWPLLAPGGILLYATCSILRRENAERVDRFLARESTAEAMAMDVPWGRLDGPGRQILPAEDGMDGFFYAGLRRT